MLSPARIHGIERFLNRHIRSEEIPGLKRLNDVWIRINWITDDSRRYRVQYIDEIIEMLKPIVEALEKDNSIILSVENATKNLEKISKKNGDDRSAILAHHAIKDEKKIFKYVRISEHKLLGAISLLNGVKHIISGDIAKQKRPSDRPIQGKLHEAIKITKEVYQNIRAVIFLERHTDAYLRQLG